MAESCTPAAILTSAMDRAGLIDPGACPSRQGTGGRAPYRERITPLLAGLARGVTPPSPPPAVFPPPLAAASAHLRAAAAIIAKAGVIIARIGNDSVDAADGIARLCASLRSALEEAEHTEAALRLRQIAQADACQSPQQSAANRSAEALARARTGEFDAAAPKTTGGADV